MKKIYEMCVDVCMCVLLVTWLGQLNLNPVSAALPCQWLLHLTENLYIERRETEISHPGPTDTKCCCCRVAAFLCMFLLLFTHGRYRKISVYLVSFLSCLVDKFKRRR